MIPVDVRAAALPALGFLALSGPDAAAFLSAQFSQRMPPANSGTACLAAWHDPKGRVRSLCRILAAPGALILIAERAGIAPLAQQLRRYVLRADVAIEDVSDCWRAVALLPIPGRSDGGISATACESADLNPTRCEPLHGVQQIPLGPGLSYWLGLLDNVDAACRRLPRAAPDAAIRAEIALGLPPLGYWPEPHFLGQMLNLDRLEAIAFDKGCYPGQEVLTRAHRLGSVKRRLFRYASPAAAPAAGTLLLDSALEPVGDVVRAIDTDAGCELLAVTRSDASVGALVCADAPEHSLRRLPLPTDSPDDQKVRA